MAVVVESALQTKRGPGGEMRRWTEWTKGRTEELLLPLLLLLCCYAAVVAAGTAAVLRHLAPNGKNGT